MHFIRCWLEVDDFEVEGSMKRDFHSIRAQCLAKGTLYEDPDFPANDFSIYQSTPPEEQEIHWKRPAEIITNPKFVTDGYSRFDVRQGKLDNCWFVASCAALTSHPKLFGRVVPQDNGNFEEGEYAGMFHFHFWQYGEWVDVIVDDRLPVVTANADQSTTNDKNEKKDVFKLLYTSSSTENEFWAALLEKAYAKLHGSYKALDGGTGAESMVDFTGGMAEFYLLEQKMPKDLFERMESSLDRKSLITAGIHKDTKGNLKSVGLNQMHEYSVTRVYRLDATKHLLSMCRSTANPRIICVRNPSGRVEWKGAWSDESVEWLMVKEEMKEELLINREDGEFWISFEDFVMYFDDVSICYQHPGDMEKELKTRYPWEMVTEMGEWKRGVSAGGSEVKSFWRNPQYFLQLSENEASSAEEGISLTIGLMQKHHRTTGTKFLWMGILLYQIPDHILIRNRSLPKTFFDSVQPVEFKANFDTGRETVVRYKVQPGRYVIVPHTKKPQQEAEFILRIFSEGRVTKTMYGRCDQSKSLLSCCFAID